MTDEASIEEIKKDDAIAKNYLKLIKEGTQKSNSLPNHGEDYDYVSSFEEFQELSSQLGSKILNTMQAIIKRNKLRGNVGTDDALMSLDEKFDVIIDVNDQLFERMALKIDEAMGMKKEASLITISRTPKNKSTATNNTPKNFAYSLLTAKNISRPQQYFRDKIDNSLNPFYPKLKSKPNAIVSFEDSIKICDKEGLNNSKNLCFEHPYKAELEAHKVDDSFIQVTEPVPPKDIMQIPFLMINEEDQLYNLCSKLESVREFAVDLEAHSFRSYQGFTCLMQISTRDKDFIIDTLALRHLMHKLNDCFTNPSILKVFHGADMDIVWLQRDFGIYVVNMFDTHQASRALTFQHNSLAYLMKYYCNKDVDKKYQLADWRIRPLPDELITYAREDTQSLLYIYDCLKKDLVQRGNGTADLLLSVFEKSNGICKKTYEKQQLHETSFREMFFSYQSRNCLKTILNAQQMEALKHLYSWRDRIARQEDESNGYVMPNHMLLQIAEHLPKEPEGILACCKPIPPLVKQQLLDIHQIVLRARDPTLLVQKSTKKDTLKPSCLQHPKFFASLKSPHDFSHPIENNLYSKGEGDNSNIINFDYSLMKKDPIINLTHKKTQKPSSISATFEDPLIMFLPANLCKNNYDEDETKQTKDEMKWKFLPSTKIATSLNNIKSIPEVQVLNEAVNQSIESSTLEVIQSIREQMNKKQKIDGPDNRVNGKVKQKKNKKKKTKGLTLSVVEPFVYKKIDLHAQIVDEKMSKKNRKLLKRKEAVNPHSIEESDYTPAHKKYTGSNLKCLSYKASAQENKASKAKWPKR